MKNSQPMKLAKAPVTSEQDANLNKKIKPAYPESLRAQGV